MERYAAGDDAAFAVVYDELAPRLQRHLRRHLRCRAVVEDLVQQTFLQMHRARGRFIPGASVVPWAFAIALRLMIDVVRHEEVRGRLRAPGATTSEDEPDKMFEADQTAQRVAGVLARLPASQRQAFELTRLDGLSQHETASALGITESAVKSLVHRATQALRAELELDGESA
jgi:RNA polymerase sigma-70 factor, ECF subfamily